MHIRESYFNIHAVTDIYWQGHWLHNKYIHTYVFICFLTLLFIITEARYYTTTKIYSTCEIYLLTNIFGILAERPHLMTDVMCIWLMKLAALNWDFQNLQISMWISLIHTKIRMEAGDFYARREQGL